MKELTLERVSKTMAHALRHSPQSYELSTDPEGWVELKALSKALTEHFGAPVTIEMICDVVLVDAKARYMIQAAKIRAVQGHSIPVDLGLKSMKPPKHLFHGTVEEFSSSILQQGLKRGQRQHVHLSETVETALSVGARRGEPVLLTVTAEAAHAQGVEFFQAENGVWLTEFVPAEFVGLTV